MCREGRSGTRVSTGLGSNWLTHSPCIKVGRFRKKSDRAGEVRSQHPLALGFHSRNCLRLPNEEPKGPPPRPAQEAPAVATQAGLKGITAWGRRTVRGRRAARSAAEPGGTQLQALGEQISVSHAAQGVPSSRLPRGRDGLRGPVPPAPPAGSVALTSGRGRQRRRTQAASPQQQSPQLARHVRPTQYPVQRSAPGTTFSSGAA